MDVLLDVHLGLAREPVDEVLDLAALSEGHGVGARAVEIQRLVLVEDVDLAVAANRD